MHPKKKKEGESITELKLKTTAQKIKFFFLALKK